jgi:hypothetical protein
MHALLCTMPISNPCSRSSSRPIRVVPRTQTCPQSAMPSRSSWRSRRRQSSSKNVGRLHIIRHGKSDTVAYFLDKLDFTIPSLWDDKRRTRCAIFTSSRSKDGLSRAHHWASPNGGEIRSALTSPAAPAARRRAALRQPHTSYSIYAGHDVVEVLTNAESNVSRAVPSALLMRGDIENNRAKQ